MAALGRAAMMVLEVEAPLPLAGTRLVLVGRDQFLLLTLFSEVAGAVAVDTTRQVHQGAQGAGAREEETQAPVLQAVPTQAAGEAREARVLVERLALRQQGVQALSLSNTLTPLLFPTLEVGSPLQLQLLEVSKPRPSPLAQAMSLGVNNGTLRIS